MVVTRITDDILTRNICTKKQIEPRIRKIPNVVVHPIHTIMGILRRPLAVYKVLHASINRTTVIRPSI